MQQLKIFFVLLIFIWVSGCNDIVDSQVKTIADDDPIVTNDPSEPKDWIIPTSEIFDGGPGKDGIPALTYPDFVPVSESHLQKFEYLKENELILVIKHGDLVKGYPHSILNWHEIVNDRIGGYKLALTYCPLTGSGIAWNRILEGEETTFGVSGLLYNSNLIPYDRKTESNWSQMQMQSVQGILGGDDAELFPFAIVEMRVKTFKWLFPDAQVMATTTGYSRDYGAYPYRDYRVNNNMLIFPVSNEDSRLQRKQRIIGITSDGSSTAYPIPTDVYKKYLVNDIVGIDPVVVFVQASIYGGAAFSRLTDDGEVLTFVESTEDLPVIMEDNEGSKWNIFGEAVSGPRLGERLKAPKSYAAYWFAWAAFFPSTNIYEQ